MIGITGARSGIGRLVASELERSGHDVIRFGRRQSDDRPFDIADDLPLDTSDLERVIHLAWAREAPQDVAAVRRIVAAAAASRTEVVLLSSLSASAATSAYGAAKREAEEIVAMAGGSALRAGVIWGQGSDGILGSIARLATLPIVCPHLSPEPLLAVSEGHELARVLAETGLVTAGEVVVAAHPDHVPLSTLAHSIRGAKRGIHLPISTGFALAAAEIAERVVALPFRSDSIRSVIDGDAGTELRSIGAFPGPEAFTRWASSAFAGGTVLG